MKMMENMSAIIGGGTPRTTAVGAREPKALHSSKFQGEAHDVNRFQRSCENVFSIESSWFLQDTIKICYTGNILEGTAAFNCYEASHNFIDKGPTDRAAGQHVQLDPQWATWDIFSHSFRSLFGDRVTREEAVVKWNKLPQTASRDTFLDQRVQLM